MKREIIRINVASHLHALRLDMFREMSDNFEHHCLMFDASKLNQPESGMKLKLFNVFVICFERQHRSILIDGHGHVRDAMQLF